MKNLILLMTLFSFTSLFSQCIIIGADQLQVGEKQEYSVENAIADCENCYKWMYADQKIIFESDSRINPLTVKGAVTGAAILSLEIKTPKKTLNCQKTIQVIEPTSKVLTVNAPKCDIEIELFNEVRNSDELVTFVPLVNDGVYKYEWTATYGNGAVKVMNDKNPGFAYSQANGILDMKLRVTSSQCVRTISKKYEPSFWMFFYK